MTTADHNPAAYGATVTLTATVTGSSGTPTGTVAFSAKVNNGPRWCARRRRCRARGNSATATCAYTPPTSGGTGLTATVTSAYSGDPTYAAKTAAAYTLKVDGNATVASFTLTTNLNPVTSGHSLTMTATVDAARAGAPRARSPSTTGPPSCARRRR